MKYEDDKRVFFDHLAGSWDSIIECDLIREKISFGLSEFDIKDSEIVVDLGCGTGNLTQALLNVLSDKGRVVAIDFSEEMLSLAQKKISDPRVQWILADALSLTVPDASIDRVICYCTWPHFSFPDLVLDELRRVLKPGGWLYIWHSDSRERINRIHAEAGGVIANDLMIPAIELAAFVDRHGFQVSRIVDDPNCYLVAAQNVTV